MNGEALIITLTYPDGAGISLRGQGAIVYTAEEEERLCAVTGRLTLADLAQLITELMESFGGEDVMLAASLAMVTRRLNAENDSID